MYLTPCLSIRNLRLIELSGEIGAGKTFSLGELLRREGEKQFLIFMFSEDEILEMLDLEDNLFLIYRNMASKTLTLKTEVIFLFTRLPVCLIQLVANTFDLSEDDKSPAITYFTEAFFWVLRFLGADRFLSDRESLKILAYFLKKIEEISQFISKERKLQGGAGGGKDELPIFFLVDRGNVDILAFIFLRLKVLNINDPEFREYMCLFFKAMHICMYCYHRDEYKCLKKSDYMAEEILSILLLEDQGLESSDSFAYSICSETNLDLCTSQIAMRGRKAELGFDGTVLPSVLLLNTELQVLYSKIFPRKIGLSYLSKAVSDYKIFGFQVCQIFEAMYREVLELCVENFVVSDVGLLKAGNSDRDIFKILLDIFNIRLYNPKF